MRDLERAAAKDAVPLADSPFHTNPHDLRLPRSGEPPVHAEAAAKNLPNAHHVVVRNGSHSFAGTKGCIDLLIASFIENPARPQDASCAEKIKRPPFARPD